MKKQGQEDLGQKLRDVCVQYFYDMMSDETGDDEMNPMSNLVCGELGISYDDTMSLFYQMGYGDQPLTREQFMEKCTRAMYKRFMNTAWDESMQELCDEIGCSELEMAGHFSDIFEHDIE